MVEFYAPWCPACQQIELIWESFAKESEHLDITVGKVDVTQEPGLSGRFFVTTLPTIYHANDGVFRRYRGSRTLEDLQSYVLEKKMGSCGACSRMEVSIFYSDAWYGRTLSSLWVYQANS